MSFRWGLGLLCAVLLCYLPHVLWGEWVYEDVGWVVSAQRGEIGGGWGRSLFRAFWLWQWSLAPMPGIFHSVSVALHAVVALLTGRLAMRFGLTAPTAWLAAAVVLLHPLSVETVAYAAQQNELLAAIGVLGACLLATYRWWKAHVSVGIFWCAAFGMLSKESAVAALGFVPLIIASRTYPDRPRWASPWIPAALALGLMVFVVYHLGGIRVLANMGEAPGVRATALDWLLVQSTAVMRTMGLLLVPIGLTVDYDYDLVPRLLRWLALSGLVSLAVVVLRLRRLWPMEALCLASMLIVVAPRLLVQTPRSIFNDHQAYLMLPFFGLLVASMWERIRAAARSKDMRDKEMSEPHTGEVLLDLRTASATADVSGLRCDPGHVL